MTKPPRKSSGGAGKAPRAPKNAKAAQTSRPLNDQQRRFAAEYVKDHNATAAYQRAGYKASGKAAEACSSRLLSDAKVRAEVDRLEAQVIERVQHATGITLERTVQEIGRVAFLDPRRLFGPTGAPLALTELDDDTAAAIAGLDVVMVGNAEMGVGQVNKIKLADKLGALDKLMRHLGGYKQDNEQAGKATAGSLAALLGAMKRSALPVVAKPDDGDDE